MDETKRGRPEGRAYPEIRSLRLKAEDLADAEWLAGHWRCSQQEAIRRALREAAQRERKK